MTLVRKKIRCHVNGVLLLDKPLNITSNRALQMVKHLFVAAKAGHTGSLDPLATGMLPICLGEATKFSQFLLNADKEYVVTGQLGLRTDTGDAEGKIIQQRAVENFSLEKIESILKQFHGEITQIPPKYSALKLAGQPLYVLARQGIEFTPKSRQVNIYQLQLLDYQTDQLQLRVRCSKGTYIRTLVEDIGEALGCGAYVTALRRTTIAHYQSQQMVTLENLVNTNVSELNQYLLPVDAALIDWPQIELTPIEMKKIMQGQSIQLAEFFLQPGLVRLYFEKDFLGIAEVSADGIVQPKRLVQVL